MADDQHHFDFDLDRGIRAQVVEKLENSPLLLLSRGVGPQASGVYALYLKGKLVYIGKASKETTKSGRTLRMRFSEHAGKIGGRKNISLTDMKYRYLTFDSEWWVFAAEFALITHYAPEWNASGFGSKVPGQAVQELIVSANGTPYIRQRRRRANKEVNSVLSSIRKTQKNVVENCFVFSVRNATGKTPNTLLSIEGHFGKLAFYH